MAKRFLNWSSGKDSALSLYRLIKAGEQPDLLLTTIGKEEQRIGMHGLRRSLLVKQAEAIGIPLKIIELEASLDHEGYNDLMKSTMNELKVKGFDTAVFGDIFLADLKAYRESQLNSVGMKGEFPLWGEDTRALIKEFIANGFSSMIVSAADEHFDKNFLGTVIDEQFLDKLPDAVDPCGENGEFHSFCYDGPIFEKDIPFNKGKKVIKYYDAPKDDKSISDPRSSIARIGFHYLDLLPK